jgi:hypothetical protein
MLLAPKRKLYIRFIIKINYMTLTKYENVRKLIFHIAKKM